MCSSDLNATTLGGTDASAFVAGALSPHWSASLLGSGNGQGRRDTNGDGWADLAGYARGVVRPRFYWDDKNGHTALLTSGFTYEDRNGGTMSGAVLPATGLPYEEALGTRRYDAGGNVHWLFGGALVATARFSHSELQHEHTFGEILEHDRHELSFAEVAIRGTVGPNTWVAGVAGQRDAYRSHDVPRFAYTYTAPGVFLQDDIAVTPWLSVSASGRLDSHNVYGTRFSPRIAALLQIGRAHV